VLRGVGFDLGAIERDMAELDQAGSLAQMQDLPEQRAQRLQVPPAELRHGAEIRRIERHDAHEINALAARLRDAARGVNAAAIGIEQQRRHHHGIERRLPTIAVIARSDRGEVDLVPHQAQHKAGEMVFGHKVLHLRRQQQRLIDLPGAECLAHAQDRI
jgi:signal transduction histidine kinase